MATERTPQPLLPPGAPAPLAQAAGVHAELDVWRAALRGVRENPLALAFQLARQRRLGRIPWLRRQAVPVIFAVIIIAAFTFIMVDNPGMRPEPAEWPWLALLFIGVPLYGIWLLRGIYELALLSQQLLGVSGRRAAHLQMDDMLALTPLTGPEIIAGTWWAVVRPLLPLVLAGGLLIWLLGLGLTLQFGDTFLEDQARVLVVLGFAPLTIACIALCSAATFTILSLWWVAMGRALKADQLSVAGALIYGIGQIIWIPAMLALMSELGFGGYYDSSAAQDFLYALLAGGLGVFGVWLMLGLAERTHSLRAGFAAVGPLLPLLVGFAFFALSLSNMNEDLNYLFGDWGNFMERMMPAMLLSWGSLVPLDPLAIPHPVLLGFVDDPYGPARGYVQNSSPWPAPLQFAALLLTQAGILALCARSAARAVELRRRAL
jgi:hypothetical protein